MKRKLCMENVDETLRRIKKGKEVEDARKGGFIMGMVITVVFFLAVFISWKWVIEPMNQYEESSLKSLETTSVKEV